VDLCTSALKKDEKTYCFDDDWIFHTFAQTTLKSAEKTTELNEVAIIRTKNGRTESRSNHFNFSSSLV
jgi:hypothetical protein